MTQSEHTRKIIHIDMDMFYAAVELLYKPTLARLFVGVGHAGSAFTAVTLQVRLMAEAAVRLSLMPHRKSLDN